MPYMLEQYDNLEPARWSWWRRIFSKDECQRIIDIGEALGMKPSKVGGGEDGSLDLKQRNSYHSWIDWTEEFDWVYKALAERIEDHNKRFFGFHINGFKEAIQITRYTEGCFYNWHQDSGMTNQFRKLTMVVNLSSAEDYEGGELELFGGDGGIMSKELGNMVMFPSYEQHRARKVTRGTRYSLVAWIHGPRLV